ncbi:MAG: hypothetical protein ABI439_04995 [Rhodospirillales bacterium]
MALFKRSTGYPTKRGRTLEVGWVLQPGMATAVWFEPQPFRREGPPPPTAKAVQNCPAVIDYDARHFVVPCPVDLNIALAKDKDGKVVLRNLDGAASSVAPSHLAKLVHLNSPGQWRHPERPLIQISTPYRFIADEPCFINQMPPFLHYRREQWPGTMIAGRFQADVWPRIMMWAFEWMDPSKPLQLRRGEPWFYLRFEPSDDSDRPVRMVEAEWTPELAEYCQSIDGVTNYVKRTFSLFPIAAKRRPAKLLKKKER